MSVAGGGRGDPISALEGDNVVGRSDPDPSPAQLEVDPHTAAGRTTVGDRIRRVSDLISGNY